MIPRPTTDSGVTSFRAAARDGEPLTWRPAAGSEGPASARSHGGLIGTVAIRGMSRRFEPGAYEPCEAK